MMAWWIAFKASKAFKPVLGLAAIVAVLGLVFLLGRCTRPDKGAEAQAEQTVASGQAAATAANEAIETLQERTVTDAALDKAVDQATQEISNAQTVDAIRDVVVDSVCASASHRNDPACEK